MSSTETRRERLVRWRRGNWRRLTVRKALIIFTLIAVGLGIRRGLYHDNITVERMRKLAAEHCEDLQIRVNFASTSAWRPSRAENVELLSPTSRLHVPDEVFREVTRLTRQRNLSMSLIQVPADSFQKLSVLKHLETLKIKHTLMGDSEFLTLPPLPNLESLHISNIRVTDEGINSLARMPKLSHLELQYAFGVTGATLDQLSQLRELTVDNAIFTDEGMTAISQLPHLKTVRLQNITGVTSIGWAELAKSDSLNHVYISGGALNDAALEALAKAHTKNSFRALIIDRNHHITEVGMEHLSHCVHLNKLAMYLTHRVPHLAIEQLRSKLAFARIVVDQ